MPPFKPPPPRHVQALLRRLRKWHGARLTTALGQMKGEGADIADAAEDPFRVLIGTLLSHRTKDERTALGTERLFARFPDARRMSRATVDQVRELIRPVGFYNMKAPRVVEVARIIAEEHKGDVPDTMEGLLALPGVGRKTAACVLVYGHGKPAIPVDTHVHRISNRLGLVRTKDPDATEQALMQVLPRKDWLMYNEYLVSFGKEVCRPVGPRCGDCTLASMCPSARVPKGDGPGRKGPAAPRPRRGK